MRRPRLYGLLLKAAWRFRARDWYRRPPFLPLPPPEYLAWRMHTAYGDEEVLPSLDELERYLRWVARARSPRGSAEVRV
ncbi:MAG TPA: hypothetical protein VKZ58_07310 [Longimicrobiales bacterium]|nr:hypothetical protein [Longimicrobiales bacterium]